MIRANTGRWAIAENDAPASQDLEINCQLSSDCSSIGFKLSCRSASRARDDKTCARASVTPTGVKQVRGDDYHGLRDAGAALWASLTRGYIPRTPAGVKDAASAPFKSGGCSVRDGVD